MPPDVPTQEPTELWAGDFVTWKISDSDFPASDGWTLKYALVKSDTQITITSSADGDDHLVEVAATTTADWTAGKYRWQGYFENGSGARYTTRPGGMIEIKADYSAASSGHDYREHCEKMRDALRAKLESRATDTQLSYKIGDKEVRYLSLAETVKQLKFYEAECDRMEQADRIAQGLGHKGNILVRF